MKKRKGNVLAENLVFIILNLVFLSILILFVVSKTGNPAHWEEIYAKQIALIIDAAKPYSEITLNMEKGFDIAKEEGIPKEDIVTINENIVTVKLSPGTGYSYSFFNNVKVDSHPDNINTNDYYFGILENVEK